MTTTTMQEWRKQQDDVVGLPFGVTFENTIAPQLPQEYFATQKEAMATLKGPRAVRNVYERRPPTGVNKECDEARLICGKWY